MPKLTPFYSLLLLPVFFAGCKKGVSTTKAIDISQYTSKMIGTRLWSGSSAQFWPPDTVATTSSVIDSPFTMQAGTDNTIMLSGYTLNYSGQDTVAGTISFSAPNDGNFDGSQVLTYYYLRDSMVYSYYEGHHEYYASLQIHTN